ncbi:MAG: VWA domain-containing protein [Pseudomonadota bacterium]
MKRIAQLLAAIAIAALALAGCSKSKTEAGGAPAANTFRILAGSELKDVAELVQAYGKTQDMNVVFDYSGTLDAVDRLAQPNNYDAVWISHGKYLQLVPEVKNKVKASEKTMYSRVVLGVKPNVARALGWKSGKTGWADVVAAAKAGKFHFAMTNPTGSNTGFVALAGLAAELSGKGDALEEQDIPGDKLKDMFAGQAMTAGSSGALADMFMADASRVDGIINYESVIRSMAAKGQPLEVIIPKEGVITADYPLMLLAASKQGEFYAKLLAYVRADATQKVIAANTFRSPLGGTGSDEVVNELPFPASLKVVDAILKGFLDSYSKPASSYFVLDVSGSMKGNRLASLKEAMLALSNSDASGSGRFSTFRGREHIEMMPFSSTPQTAVAYDLSEDAAANRKILDRLSSDISSLHAGGGTAIFDSIASVYGQAQLVSASHERTVSIVLLTDGVNTEGMDLAEFKSWLERKGGPKVPVFAIIFGDADPSQMQALAQSTGGRVFDARTVQLARVMKDIRTYQ